ncbi:MAG TPA: antitoxin family protein [Tepidisphaeraceae bacterium]|nr:antitoxin family protein [Tepidisphaeraceae bacterium]
MTIRAIYENGVFRPVEPVALPERTPVDISLPETDSDERRNQERIFALLRTSYPSGESDVAERHNEHQP